MLTPEVVLHTCPEGGSEMERWELRKYSSLTVGRSARGRVDVANDGCSVCGSRFHIFALQRFLANAPKQAARVGRVVFGPQCGHRVELFSCLGQRINSFHMNT